MSIVLNNESCLDFLPRVADKSVNLVLIDPPYTISRATGFESCGEKGVERFKMSYEFGEWDNEIFVLDKVMEEWQKIEAQKRFDEAPYNGGSYRRGTNKRSNKKSRKTKYKRH